MLSAIHTALSGLSGFTKQVEVTGHNLANVNTEEFRNQTRSLSRWRRGSAARYSKGRICRPYCLER